MIFSSIWHHILIFFPSLSISPSFFLHLSSPLFRSIVSEWKTLVMNDLKSSQTLWNNNLLQCYRMWLNFVSQTATQNTINIISSFILILHSLLDISYFFFLIVKCQSLFLLFIFDCLFYFFQYLLFVFYFLFFIFYFMFYFSGDVPLRIFYNRSKQQALFVDLWEQWACPQLNQQVKYY